MLLWKKVSAVANAVCAMPQITFNTIKTRLKDTMNRLGSQKFYDPADGRDYVESELSQVEHELNKAFKDLMEEFRR